MTLRRAPRCLTEAVVWGCVSKCFQIGCREWWAQLNYCPALLRLLESHEGVSYVEL